MGILGYCRNPTAPLQSPCLQLIFGSHGVSSPTASSRTASTLPRRCVFINYQEKDLTRFSETDRHGRSNPTTLDFPLITLYLSPVTCDSPHKPKGSPIHLTNLQSACLSWIHLWYPTLVSTIKASRNGLPWIHPKFLTETSTNHAEKTLNRSITNLSQSESIWYTKSLI